MSDSPNSRTLGDAVHAARQHATAPFITAHQAAEILELDLGTLAKWRWLRKGPPFYKRGRVVRYLEDEVREWMRYGRVEPVAGAIAPDRPAPPGPITRTATPAPRLTLQSPASGWVHPSLRPRRRAS